MYSIGSIRLSRVSWTCKERCRTFPIQSRCVVHLQAQTHRLRAHDFPSLQHLGSSVGLVASAYHVRFRLDGILRLFRGNVCRLHPDHRLRLPPTRSLIDPAPRRKGDLTRAFHLIDPSTQALPDECLELTEDLARFLKVEFSPNITYQPSLSYFPEN